MPLTAGGPTIVVGIFTLDESSGYSLNWGDTDVNNTSSSTDDVTTGGSASSSFTHHEQGTFSNGAGGPNAPTLSSQFFNKLLETYGFNDGDTSTFNTGSASGSDGEAPFTTTA